MTSVSSQAARQLRVVTVGHVDHGKSTLIGRLLADTGSLPDGKVEELRAASERRGVPFEWSFVLDALQSERDQAITIDTTRVWLRTPERDFVLIDAPGHTEFLRNMVTGASDADAALLAIDASEGVGEQTRRHAILLDLLGVGRVVVAVNKMDSIDFSRERFDAISREIESVLASVGATAHAIVPVSARDGDNVVNSSERAPWYEGPTISEALASLEVARVDAAEEPLRLAVQGVMRRGLARIVMGRIESGTLAVGDGVVISPGDRRAVVKTIEAWPEASSGAAGAGYSVAFTLDRATFIERGDVVGAPEALPLSAERFRARVLWLGRSTLREGDEFRLRIGTRTSTVKVREVERVLDLASLERRAGATVATNDIVDVVLEARDPLALHAEWRQSELGRFILIDRLDVVAGGVVLEPLENDRHLVTAVHTVDAAARTRQSGHRGVVVWLTGLPASGKTTLGMELERRLFERRVASFVLDGDNVRRGLNKDLDFTPAGRAENVRRVGEVARLFADAGVVAIVALVSPSAASRAAARAAAPENAFFEVYVKADAATCAARDPKAHYAAAASGAIANFTGVDGGYEPPAEAELVLDTAERSIDECASELTNFVFSRVATSGQTLSLGWS